LLSTSLVVLKKSAGITMSDMVVARKEGLYCVPGDFFIDPWRPVPRAVITHAHADHARVGHGHYLAATSGAGILKSRLGDINIETLQYGETLTHNGVTISLHPAGHVLGSAQVRMEYRGEVWVASGDYKVEADGTCAAFEPIRCDTFITESTFGLPIYRWQPQSEILPISINGGGAMPMLVVAACCSAIHSARHNAFCTA
jgi:putative mRNA 3-end processing factor